MKGLLATQGVQLPVNGDFLARMNATRLWDGTSLPDGIKQRLTRVWAQLEFLNAQLEELEEARAALKTDRQTATGRRVGIRPESCGNYLMA